MALLVPAAERSQAARGTECEILLPVQGLYQRPLTANNIEKHLGALGLEAEFATHSMIRGLSGGQKVKLVLAAATWQVRFHAPPVSSCQPPDRHQLPLVRCMSPQSC